MTSEPPTATAEAPRCPLGPLLFTWAVAGAASCFGGVVPLEAGGGNSPSSAAAGLAPPSASEGGASQTANSPATAAEPAASDGADAASQTQFGSPGLGAPLPAPLPPDATDKATPSFLSDYTKRTYVHRSFVVASHSAVTDRALDIARYVVEQMIDPQQARQLRALGSALVVIGAQEVFTDQPGFTQLGLTSYGTSWNNTAGSGASLSLPVSTVFERHLLQLDSDGYRDENILVHEFSHHVMEIWLQAEKPDVYQAIRSARDQALTTQAYAQGSYATSNAGEYFAEGAQIFFNATQRTDVGSTGGMTRDRMQEADESLWALLCEIYASRWDCQRDVAIKCFRNQSPPSTILSHP